MIGYNPNKQVNLSFGSGVTNAGYATPMVPLGYSGYTATPTYSSLGSIGVDPSAFSSPVATPSVGARVGVDPLSRLGTSTAGDYAVSSPSVVNPAVASPTIETPDATKPESFLSKIGGFDSLLTGLQTIGGLYFANKNYGLLKDELAFNKRAFETNLANSEKNYNTALEDRARARAAFAGKGDGYVQDYMKKHSL